MFYSESLKKNNYIQHCFFSRKNGVSSGIYESLNCGIGSKDENANVEKNLNIVSKKFKIKKEQLVLMRQTHSNKVQIVEDEKNLKRMDCDGILTKNNSLALCVLTADCAPILLYEKKEKIIGSIHAGWKGSVNGIIENTIEKLNQIGGNVENLQACVGPCISQESYEVKDDFYSTFINKTKYNDSFFLKNEKKRFYFDLRGFINKKLRDCGVLEIDNISIDTFAMKSEYFSHRRAQKLGENDYGRCISVIKKISSEK